MKKMMNVKSNQNIKLQFFYDLCLYQWHLIMTILYFFQSVIIADGSEQFNRFIKLPQPLNFKVYIFNVTNPDMIQQGAIPIVEEIGPYVYK